MPLGVEKLPLESKQPTRTVQLVAFGQRNQPSAVGPGFILSIFKSFAVAVVTVSVGLELFSVPFLNASVCCEFRLAASQPLVTV